MQANLRTHFKCNNYSGIRQSRNNFLVAPLLLEIGTAIEQASDYFSLNDSQEIANIINLRKGITEPIHLVAYVLNPKFKGENLTDYEKQQAFEYIIEKAKLMDLPEQEIIQDYVNYMGNGYV